MLAGNFSDGSRHCRSGLAWLALVGALAALGCNSNDKPADAGEPARAAQPPIGTPVPTIGAAAAAQPLRSCQECQDAACENLAQGCALFSGDQAARCNEVSACVKRSGCGHADKSLTACYCGALPTEKCMSAPESGAGAPDGACAKEIKAAIGAKTHIEVLTGYVKLQSPGGAAMAQLSCQKANCKRECSFAP